MDKNNWPAKKNNIVYVDNIIYSLPQLATFKPLDSHNFHTYENTHLVTHYDKPKKVTQVKKELSS